MIIESPGEKKELDKIPNADEHGDPIYKIDGESEEDSEGKADVGELSNSKDDSEFKDTPQDLKDENSQE